MSGWIDVSKCRPEVLDFAIAMEKVLKKNDDKSSWKDEDVDWLFDRLVDEMRELKEAINTPGFDELNKVSQAEVCREAIDVANFAMMIFDNLNGKALV